MHLAAFCSKATSFASRDESLFVRYNSIEEAAEARHRLQSHVHSKMHASPHRISESHFYTALRKNVVVLGSRKASHEGAAILEEVRETLQAHGIRQVEMKGKA